jgi:hypothetical protein
MNTPTLPTLRNRALIGLANLLIAIPATLMGASA